MKHGILFLILICPGLIITSPAQKKTDTLLQRLLLRNRDSILQMVLHHPKIYRYQIIYTQINRDAAGQPTFRN